MVVLDLRRKCRLTVLRRLPFTTWLRLHRVIEGSETACVLIGSEPISRSAGGGDGAGRASGFGLRTPCRILPELGVWKPGACSVKSLPVWFGACGGDPNVCLPVSAAAC